MRKLLFVLLVFVVALLALLVLFNTFNLHSRQSNIAPATDLPTYPKAPPHLLQAVRFPTTNDSLGHQAMTKLHRWMRQTYPRLFAHPKIEWRELGPHNWVMKWSGHTAEAPPIVLYASPEVVYPATEQLPEWQYDPFLGRQDTAYLYGQGVQGGKAAMVALLEVLHELVPQVPTPARTLYIAFPYPENQGVAALVQALQQNGIAPDYILSTGGGIHQGGWCSIEAPIAQIGTGQLAGADYPLVRSKKVPWAKAFSPVRQALHRLDEADPMVQTFVQDLAPELAFQDRVFVANPWLFSLRSGHYLHDTAWLQSILGGQLRLFYEPHQDTALLRLYAPNAAQLPTTQALQTALAPAGFTVQPPVQQWTARSTAPSTNRIYQQLSNTSKAVFPNLLTAPSWVATPPVLTTLSMPAPWYQFHPMVYTPTTWRQAQRGITERLPLDAYQQWLQFYHHLLVHAL